MGLDASNARMQTLVARLSDIHFRGQQINNQRLLIASQEEQLSEAYSESLSQTKLVITDSSGNQNDFSLANLQTIANTVICTVSSDGTATAIKESTDTNTVIQGLKNGKYQAYTIESGTYDTSGNFQGTLGTQYNWSGTLPDGSQSQIQSVADTDNQEEAEMKYDAQLGQLQPEDKALEMQLKDLDTQAQAVQTEIDSVKKVIDKDIELTFKTFAGNG